MIARAGKFMAAVGLIAVVVLGALYLQKLSPRPEVAKTELKCPEDYASEEEYRRDLEAFLAEFLESNPEATIEDLGRERMQFLVDHNCQRTLEHIRNTDVVTRGGEAAIVPRN